MILAWVKTANRTASLEVFTTNYDVLLERSLEAARVPVFDAFVGSYEPFFYPECLDDDGMLPTNKWVRLWNPRAASHNRPTSDRRADQDDRALGRPAGPQRQ